MKAGTAGCFLPAGPVDKMSSAAMNRIPFDRQVFILAEISVVVAQAAVQNSGRQEDNPFFQKANMETGIVDRDGNRKAIRGGDSVDNPLIIEAQLKDLRIL